MELSNEIIEEAKIFLGKSADSELTDEELAGVVGGVDGIVDCGRDVPWHEWVMYGSEAEVQFIFNVGDIVECFSDSKHDTTAIVQITERKKYSTPSGAKWWDVYKVQLISGVLPLLGRTFMPRPYFKK